MINSLFRSKWVSFALIFTLLCVKLSFAAEDSPTPSPSRNIKKGIELPIEKTPWEKANEHLFPIIYPTDDPPPQAVYSVESGCGDGGGCGTDEHRRL